MVPMSTCGLVRSNFAFATATPPAHPCDAERCSVTSCLFVPRRVEQGADGLAVVNAPYGFGERRGDGQDAQFLGALLLRDRHGVGAHDLQDVRLLPDPLQRTRREESVGAGDPDRTRPQLP